MGTVIRIDATRYNARRDMRHAIIDDIDRRIAILTESINTAPHKASEVLTLQVVRRAFEVMRDDIDRME